MPFLFKPPTRSERRGTHPLFGRLKTEQGVSVLKEQGFFRQVMGPSAEEVEGADIAYLGGYVHTISLSEALDLIEAGYDEYITEAALGYGQGLYGVGLYGL